MARPHLHKGAVVEDGRLVHGLHIDEVEPAPLVAEEQFPSRLVQLEPVDLRVVGNLHGKSQLSC